MRKHSSTAYLVAPHRMARDISPLSLPSLLLGQCRASVALTIFSQPNLAAACNSDSRRPSCLQLFSPDGDYLCTLASGVEAVDVAVSASGFVVAVGYSYDTAYRFDPWVVGCSL